MRALETEIRKSKDEINALKAFGHSVPQINDLQQRIKAFRAKYDQIAEVTGIDPEPKRLTVQKPIIENGVASSPSNQPITPITDAAINSVKKISIDGFTDSQNDYIQAQHKELLRYARDNNGSNEVAFVYRKGLTGRTIFKGSDDVIDFGNGLNGKGDNLFIMHNHPRNSSFSNIDILFFKNCDAAKTITIIKNNGDIEYLTKSSKYDAARFELEYDRLKSKIIRNGTNVEYDKFIKTLLRKSKSGIEWSENNG